ncbi:MAG: hypothetical protein JO185_23345, partial [Acidobacteriaceae bacterium]|nr:hypothetical protein [Acidobacteriaceae bacterium]
MAAPSDDIDVRETADTEDYQAFLDDYSNQFAPTDGEVLHGHVLNVSDREVIVD